MTQVRVQDGGVHGRGAQNSQIVHFGLGIVPIITSIKIAWPSGAVQTLIGVPADQFITVVEQAD